MAAKAALRRAASRLATAAVNACFGTVAAAGGLGFLVVSYRVPDWERSSNTAVHRRKEDEEYRTQRVHAGIGGGTPGAGRSSTELTSRACS